MPHDVFIKQNKTIFAADLFCGAGGSSTGLLNAVKELGYNVDLLAVNHWDIAIATHSKNHSKVRHLCQSIDTINPQDVIPGKRLNLLLASPECTDHSNAKGGKPRSDQKRADAWLLMRWIEKLYVENLIIENVKEFVNWGPLNAKGLPDKRHRGKYFKQFIEALEINYKVEWRILNCADYGDATTRQRFFLIARRNGKKITFPEPTHASRKEIEKSLIQPNLFNNKSSLQKWRPAREIIDWSLEGKSVFNRKKPLSENTMKRIFAGFFKYSLTPFIMGTGGPTGQQRPRSVDEPMRTILADPRQNLFVPYLLNLKGATRQMRPIDEPSFTATAFSTGQHLVEPFIANLSHTGNNDEVMCKPVDNPLNTICGKAMLGLVESYSYLVKFYGGHNSADINEPILAITANYDHYGLATPFIAPTNHGDDLRSYSVDDPMKTITQVDAWAVIQPFLSCFRKNQGEQSLQDPLKTLTTKDSYAVVMPRLVQFWDVAKEREMFALYLPEWGLVIDIYFRMLQPHELAAAMSFPKTYSFVGTRDQKVRQIGNAVPCKTMEALCKAVLGGK